MAQVGGLQIHYSLVQIQLSSFYYVGMVESADTLDLKSSARQSVEVQVFLSTFLQIIAKFILSLMMNRKQGGNYMKKAKRFFLLSTLLVVPMLTACGNKDILGLTYTFEYAQVKLPDGKIIEGQVKEWAREEKTDSIRVTFKDGKGTYFTHATNVVLYNK